MRFRREKFSDASLSLCLRPKVTPPKKRATPRFGELFAPVRGNPKPAGQTLPRCSKWEFPSSTNYGEVYFLSSSKRNANSSSARPLFGKEGSLPRFVRTLARRAASPPLPTGSGFLFARRKAVVPRGFTPTRHVLGGRVSTVSVPKAPSSNYILGDPAAVVLRRFRPKFRVKIVDV